MTMTLTGNSTPSQMRPMCTSSFTPGNEEAGCPCVAICLCPNQRLIYCSCRIVSLTEKQISSRIDEEREALSLRDGSNGGDSASLMLDVVKSLALHHSVLKVNSHGAYVEKPNDVR